MLKKTFCIIASYHSNRIIIITSFIHCVLKKIQFLFSMGLAPNNFCCLSSTRLTAYFHPFSPYAP